MLTHWQMRPTAVASGQEALAVLAQARATGRPFPLVLLDAHMPETDGFTLAACITQEPELAGATILMVSSADMPAVTVRCQEWGIARSLTKPIIQSDLWNALTTILRLPKQGHALVPPLPTPTTVSAQSLRILLAEDNPVNQKLALHLLEKRGHQVEVVSTGREALGLLARQAFDLVLMDVQMPEMDGLEATAIIRERERGTGTHLPIIALTAHALQGDKEKCLAVGMDAYVTKPMQADALFAAIDQLLSPPPA
jgi:two-component system, sensor histidine kinase and response regulator